MKLGDWNSCRITSCDDYCRFCAIILEILFHLFTRLQRVFYIQLPILQTKRTNVVNGNIYTTKDEKVEAVPDQITASSLDKKGLPAALAEPVEAQAGSIFVPSGESACA